MTDPKPGSPAHALREALRLAGVSQRQLARRLGHTDGKRIGELVHGRSQMTLPKFAEILSALDLSGGYCGQRGWWVCRPEDLLFPKK